MENEISNRLNALFHEMVDIRRFLHQYPELSHQEEHTPRYIANYHEQLGLDVRTNVGGRGVVATLTGAYPGKTIAVRADFDALPIQDEKDVPYKSTIPGVMHACGHDGHTALVLALAKALSERRSSLHGTVVFIHQHAEEVSPGGAKQMIDDGCLEGVDEIFGTHLWATEPLGKIQYKHGPFMAAADRFEIVIQGQGGHGAQPHVTKDAILIGSNVVQSLQHIVSRRLNPIQSAVISVASIEASNPFNAIADQVKMEGTVRTFDPDIQKDIKRVMDQTINGVCQSYGASYTFNYFDGHPAVVNDPSASDAVANAAKGIQEVQEVEYAEPQMGGEDFSYYVQAVPGTYFFTGAKPKDVTETIPHHHPKFDIDERSMLIASKTLARTVLQRTGTTQAEGFEHIK
ncbi:amidohydrolase [Texcoconibacillus texcoconensis]|uniref:Amidohydrolase n=1 Tax=Texcoconibacillus texcoconensis TaxID=1095777 RepID=A0A840QPD6_9BACI|nr:amidohydrolase [Texcoconibacillus texcoconensis]MBB5173229.1 amidohydrolase [Texcoconibacillus texcoconensis]